MGSTYKMPLAPHQNSHDPTGPAHRLPSPLRARLQSPSSRTPTQSEVADYSDLLEGTKRRARPDGVPTPGRTPSCTNTAERLLCAKGPGSLGVPLCTPPTPVPAPRGATHRAVRRTRAHFVPSSVPAHLEDAPCAPVAVDETSALQSKATVTCQARSPANCRGGTVTPPRPSPPSTTKMSRHTVLKRTCGQLWRLWECNPWATDSEGWHWRHVPAKATAVLSQTRGAEPRSAGAGEARTWLGDYPLALRIC